MDIEHERARVAAQDAELRGAACGGDAAWQLGCLLREAALARGAALAIEVRLAMQTVFFCAMPSSTPLTADWVRRKRNVAELFGASSYGVGLGLRAEGISLQDKTGLATRDYAAFGGSVALRAADGQIWGCATVSGLPQRDDHELVVDAVRRWRTGLATAQIESGTRKQGPDGA